MSKRKVRRETPTQALKRRLAHAEARIEGYREQLDATGKARLAAETKLRERVDLSMIDARNRMLSNLGQLVEAVSKAIVYVVGKELL